MNDPVKDALRMVYLDGYRKGLLAGLSHRSAVSFLRGALLGVLVALVGIGVAVAQTVPNAANDHRRDLTKIARSVWGIEAPVSDLAAQIHQESGWNRTAVSPVGAQGLAQFMPSTASWIASMYADMPDPFDPRWSMLYQSRYMKQLNGQVRLAADDCERYAFALSAYNGGLRWVQKRQAMSDQPGVCLYATCNINPGIHPAFQQENQSYPLRILVRLSPIYQRAGWGPSRCRT